MTMHDYKEQIRLLVELQKVDDQIYDVTQKMENAPRKLGDLEQKFHAEESARNHILDKVAHLRDQHKRITSEMDSGEANMKKSKNKLAQVQNTKEYQAMLREMDSMEKINRTREEERITLQEALSVQENLLQEIDKSYNSLKEELEEKRSSLDTRLKEGQETIAALTKKREQASHSIPLPIFQRYEFIRKRMEHPVIVDVDEGVCSGCNIAIPPQQFIELQIGQQILNCPNCQRLIYWSQYYENPDRVASRQKPQADETVETVETSETVDTPEEIVETSQEERQEQEDI